MYFTNIFDHIYVFSISLIFRAYIFFLLTLFLSLFILPLLLLLKVLPQGG